MRTAAGGEHGLQKAPTQSRAQSPDSASTVGLNKCPCRMLWSALVHGRPSWKILLLEGRPVLRAGWRYKARGYLERLRKHSPVTATVQQPSCANRPCVDRGYPSPVVGHTMLIYPALARILLMICMICVRPPLSVRLPARREPDSTVASWFCTRQCHQLCVSAQRVAIQMNSN